MTANLVDRVRMRLAGTAGEPAQSSLAEAAGQESELLLDSAALAEL
jgi:hypothetical protein